MISFQIFCKLPARRHERWLPNGRSRSSYVHAHAHTDDVLGTPYGRSTTFVRRTIWHELSELRCRQFHGLLRKRTRPPHPNRTPFPSSSSSQAGCSPSCSHAQESQETSQGQQTLMDHLS
ncbi:hypothetical protein ANCCAN_17644 [Ancylostoma caninum]|uniref:Uncharacterized protein n=1 Tax=Ancylostoma caninum TaxID=29170 RepID=A0A368G0D7_ANCCA|nr:hypothetical protein ANCCAN_17644 [Ancylostoma caninum]